MMRSMKYPILLPFLALMVACGGSDAPETPRDANERIRLMEDSVFESSTFDLRRAQALLDVYKAYANAHQLDSMAPEYLFRAANLSKSMHDGAQSIRLYDRIITDYGNWYRLPDVYYLKAFTIDSELDQRGEAKTAYEEVINRYPDHPFAKDARAMIDNLMYTDEELIERFKQMEQDSGVAVQ